MVLMRVFASISARSRSSAYRRLRRQQTPSRWSFSTTSRVDLRRCFASVTFAPFPATKSGTRLPGVRDVDRDVRNQERLSVGDVSRRRGMHTLIVNHMRQLVGYAALARACKARGRMPSVRAVAVYFSRFGVLQRVDLPTSISSKTYVDVASSLADIRRRRSAA